MSKNTTKLFFLLLLISIPFYVSAFPTGAGTCNVEDMSSIGHGPSSLQSPAGYAVNASMTSQGAFEFTFSGPGNGFEGILVYVMSGNNRVGQFANLPSSIQFKTDCQGQDATVTHKDSNVKNFPFKLNWNAPQGTSGTLTVKSLIVKDSVSDWAQLSDVSIDPTTGASSVVANAANTGGSPSGGGYGFFQKYTLFIIMIIITTILYVVGSITEALLKRQQVKARSFAKTINGFGDAR